jgi:GNAT superfamily N-acetyltransferase
MSEPALRFTSARGRGGQLFAALEAPSWAPWLRFSPAELDLHAELFDAGQLLACDARGEPVGLLSTTRIDWDGEAATLPTWDELGADATAFRTRYAPDGNALALLSSSVRPDLRGRGVASTLVRRSREVAGLLGIADVVVPARPSGFGAHKLLHPDRAFRDYCRLRRDDGAPVDGWLRALERLGVSFVRVERKAMVIEAPAEDFRRLRRSHHPERWRRLDDSRTVALRAGEHRPAEQLRDVCAAWECGETGTWYVDPAGAAVYVESNVWGRLACG